MMVCVLISGYREIARVTECPLYVRVYGMPRLHPYFVYKTDHFPEQFIGKIN